MQFRVPQFLDIEDKIFGPFTFSQFVYLAGGGGLCFIIFKLFGFLVGLIPMLIIAGFALALTFYRPNDKPFIHLLESGFKFVVGNKLYIWKKEQRMIKKDTQKEESGGKILPASIEPRLGRSKLRDLAWSLDVLDLKKEQEQNK